MADPEDTTQRQGVSPEDGRPRRQPPIIDVEAVEVSLDGSRATTAGSGPAADPSGARRWSTRISSFLSPMTFAIIGSAGVAAGIIAGALWFYLAPDGRDEPRRNAEVSPAAAVPIPLPAFPGRAAEGKSINPPPLTGERREGDLQSRVAAVDAALASLSDRVASLERAVRDAAAAARAAGERADKVAGLIDGPPPYPHPQAGEGRVGGDEQNSAQQHDRSALEALADRVATLESQQAALQQKQEGLDRLADATTAPDKAIRIATVAVALRSAVERNSPFAAELAAARSLGLDERALASLERFAATGLPSRDELFHSLSALLPELRRLSAPPNRDLGYFERLQASAVRMLNIRPVQDQPGDDPATVMSRIEFKMAQQDVEAMVTELDKLPAPAKEFVQPWRTKALARQDALEAARRIATASLAKLGEP
jgi:hypothetical protein